MKMTHVWAGAILLLASSCLGAAAEAQTVDSAITGVTVYTRQGMVTRSASTRVGEGPTRLVVQTEAFDILSDSVTAAVFGEGEILGVQVVRVPVQEIPQEKIRELTHRLENLEQEKQVLADERKAILKQESFLDGFISPAGKPGVGDKQVQMPSTENLEAYLLFFDARYTGIYEKRRNVDDRMAVVEKEMEQLRRELSMRRGTEDRIRSGIEILFNSRKSQTIEVEARYRVDRAGWSPVYRASVDADMKGVDFAMMAAITQTTGEDWTDAALTISNAVSTRIGRLPELSPWWLDYMQPIPMKQESGLRMRSMEMADMAAAPAAEAEKRETALSFEYTLPLPVTIPSREKETQVPVLSRVIEGEFYHYTVPAMSLDAYLVCEAKADRELLPGPVNVFFENRYTGRMILEEKGPGESFTLGLGIDRSVRVNREKLKDKAKETAFFGRVERDSVIRELSYRVMAQNLKERPVVLKVIDHVPVSRTDRITVKDLIFSRAPDRRDIDEKSGVMEWDLKLDPGAVSEILTDFTVTYPKDMPRPIL